MPWLRWQNVSVAGTTRPASCEPLRREQPLVAALVQYEPGVGHVTALRQSLAHGFRIRHLRHHLWMRETRDFDARATGVQRPVDQRELVFGRKPHGLVLQARRADSPPST